MHIAIKKSAQLGFIHGGESGPGVMDGQINLGITYSWTLPIDQLEPDTTKQTAVLNTLNGVISTISAVAQSSTQSTSLVGSGGYYGPSLQLSGFANNLSPGQLQCFGAEIDLSGVNDPILHASIACLPEGAFAAQPVSGSTRWVLSITIEP